MQQSSATQSLHLSFWGSRKIVACSHSSLQCLLVSIVFVTVLSLYTSYFIFILVYTGRETGNSEGPQWRYETTEYSRSEANSPQH